MTKLRRNPAQPGPEQGAPATPHHLVFGIPVVHSAHVPPGTAFLLGEEVLVIRPAAPRWWREPRRWLRQRRLDRAAARLRSRRAEMEAWLALYRPDLRFVRWGRHGGAVVAPRVPLPEGQAVISAIGQDDRSLWLMAEMRMGSTGTAGWPR